MKKFVLFVLVALFGFAVTGYSQTATLRSAVELVKSRGENGFFEEDAEFYTQGKNTQFFALEFEEDGKRFNYTLEESAGEPSSFSITMRDGAATVFLGDAECNGTLDTYLVIAMKEFNGNRLQLLYFRYLQKLLAKYMEKL